MKTTDRKREVLFSLSFGTTFLPDNYEELKWELDLKRKQKKPEG